MRPNPLPSTPASCHTLRFDALAGGNEAYTFPCDRSGKVEINGLSDRDRDDFLFAKHLVGLLFQRPLVVVQS